VDLNVDAYIPPSYIVNEVQKLDIYKRIAAIENQAESEEMRRELMDRFGAVPGSVENLLRISLIRVLAHQVYVTEIKGKQEQIRIFLRPDAGLKVEQIPVLLGLYKKKLTFVAKGTPCFIYRYRKPELIEKEAEQLLCLTEDVLGKMKELLL
jgi:transcription-repair coupling factor (superfamily II helicase)